MSQTETSSPPGLSPLDAIRQAEAGVARRILHVRQTAEEAMTRAQEQVDALQEQARQNGFQEGQSRCKELIQQAKEEAELAIAQAQNQAALILENGHERQQEAGQWAMRVVLGLSSEERTP